MLQLLGLQNNTSRIGIDFGSCGIRAVQLMRQGETWEVIRIARSEIGQPDEAARGVDPCDIDGRLRQCLRGEQFRGRTAAVALPLTDVEFHTLELPDAVRAPNDREAREIVRWELSRLMNTAPEQIEVDYWLLPKAQSHGPNAVGVGAKHQPIVDVVERCRSAGVNCLCVDAAPTALQRFGLHLNHWKPRDVWGVLDVGYERSRLILSLGSTPVLTRDVGPGGHAWTRQIADALQVSVKTAEVQKREHGIALTGRGVRRDGDALPDTELAGIIYSALRGHLAGLAGEVKRSYEYILSRYSVAGPAEAADLVLVGGGAGLERLSDYLAQSLGIVVRTAEAYLERPECRLRFASVRGLGVARLAAAIGVALEQEA